MRILFCSYLFFVQRYDSLGDCPKEKIKEYLDKLVVIKLNGGLGTRMGLSGAKSVRTFPTQCEAEESVLTIIDCAQ